ncbi:MAG: RagB/SusD family nutrient uptake outer membrane protein [Bacteroidota bacterium]
MTSNLYIICFILLFFTACQDILDKDPIATLDAGSFFQSSDDALQALNTAYRPLLLNNDNNSFYWAFANITSDLSITGGDGSRPGLVELDAFTYTPRTEEFNTFWRLQYDGITQCNLVLDNLPDIELDEALLDQYTGEALFLRSFYYFQLAQTFGGVPLFLNVAPPDELKIPRSTREAILTQVQRDCEQAALLLPTTYSALNVGRATRGAALALAAKAYLYEEKWDKVLESIDQVKALGIYELVSDYQDNFTEGKQNNTESVWEVQHANLELGVGNFLNQWLKSKKVEGYGFAEVTEDYFNSFDDDDPRRRFAIASKDEEYFGSIYKNSYSSTKHSTRKYLQDTTITQLADGSINYTPIRYAEVLLWEAEALAELGRVSEAQAPLEEVRARARAQAGDPATALPMISTTDKNEMIDAIRHERVLELGFEFHRFFDLVRWGIAADILPDFQTDKNELFPLPQTEMDLNPALVQNPGY